MRKASLSQTAPVEILDFGGRHVLLLLHKTSLAVKCETIVSYDSPTMTKTRVAKRLSGRPRNRPMMLWLPVPQHLLETFSEQSPEPLLLPEKTTRLKTKQASMLMMYSLSVAHD